MGSAPVSEIAAEHRHPISVAMYHQMIDTGVLTEHDRVELIEGVIVAVSSQSPAHGHAVAALVKILNRALGDEWRVRPQSPLTLAGSEPEPDVAVVTAEADAAAARHPTTATLVVEVAKTSMALDRGMAAVYALAGVPEYWIVDVANQQVEVFRDLTRGAYGAHTLATVADELAPELLPGVIVPVGALFRPIRH